MNDIVLFDGVCSFCNSSVNFIIERDPNAHYKFASLQSEFGRALMLKHGLDPDKLDSIVLVSGERHWVKSDAALQIASRMSGLWPVLSIFRVVPSFIRNMVYDLVARNRYRIFGKKETCELPPPDVRSRFIVEGMMPVEAV